MKANTAKDRAVGAIMGTFIGDALGVGPHCYYGLDQLKKGYGRWIDDDVLMGAVVLAVFVAVLRVSRAAAAFKDMKKQNNWASPQL